MRYSKGSSRRGTNTIRSADMGDIERVTDIVRNATCQMEEQGIDQWDDIYPNRTTLRNDIENGHLHVIENKTGIAGFVTLSPEELPEYNDVHWIYCGRVLAVYRLTIAPEHQGRKLASRLMDFAEKEAESKGFDTIRLDVFTENPRAVALYERRGYREAGTVHFRKGLFFCYEKLVSRREGSS